MENPLLRSGLALAGANSWLYGRKLPELAGIGFLTAFDILQTDLSRTRLVVLSACETGLGEFTVGQGVLGLRHAVFAAGATGLIASLWRVPDESTRHFMSVFYRAWVSNTDAASAFHFAQLETRRSYPTTREWAGFVFCGRSYVHRADPITSNAPQIPEMRSGLAALRQLAKMPFGEILQRAGMVLSLPQGFQSTDIDRESNVPYHYAAKAANGDIEIRYAAIPFGTRAYSFSEADYQHLVYVVSDGNAVSPSAFPSEGVRKEFHAEKGLTTGISPSKRFCKEFSHGAVVFITRTDLGAAVVWYLFNDVNAALALMYSEFNSLRFERPLAFEND